jgi:hypothetical protein
MKRVKLWKNDYHLLGFNLDRVKIVFFGEETLCNVEWGLIGVGTEVFLRAIGNRQ